jgi:hypothetical protein
VAIALGLIFWIASLLTALMVTLCPLLIWFIQDYKDYPIIVKILLSWFFLGWGISMLKELLSDFKKE